MTYSYSSNQQTMTPFNIHGDHDDLSETEFLKNAIATHNKYGSTNCNFGQQNYRFITHYIEPTDTLQGLALKYGCKVCIDIYNIFQRFLNLNAKQIYLCPCI